jgi:hypothetical protein
MGSGTTVTCKKCERSWTFSGDPLLYVVKEDGTKVCCPHPVENFTAEQATGKTIWQLWRAGRMYTKTGCHCLFCLNGGHYSWDLRGAEAFIKAGIENNQPWWLGVPQTCIRRCDWFQCAICGKKGRLLLDGILDLLLMPVGMIFALKEESPIRCPSCRIGYLRFSCWIS